MEPPIEYYAARQSLRDLDGHQVAAVVDALTDEGVWDDAFVDVMDAREPETHDVLPPFLKALQHLGVPIPSTDDAVWYLIDYDTRRIVSGVVDPMEGLGQLINDVYWDYDFAGRTQQYLGDSHGLAKLIGLWWNYDEWRYCPDPFLSPGVTAADVLADLKAETVREAALLQEGLANKRFQRPAEGSH